MYLSGPHGDDAKSDSSKRLRISAPAQVKVGRGKVVGCGSSWLELNVAVVLMNEMCFNWEIEDQRRPRRNSELAREDEGPGSIAMKLLRFMARESW